jgi:acyl carrier protein
VFKKLLILGDTFVDSVKSVLSDNDKSIHPTYSPSEINAWIVAYLADLLETEPNDIDITVPFDRYGLDSSAAVGLTGDLADWMGIEIEPTLLYDYPTVTALVQYLATELEQNLY